MPTRILLEATKKGIHLFLKDGELAFKAPKGALTPDLKQAIRDKKSEIVDLLKSHQKSLSGTEKMTKVAGDNPIPLSFSQQRLWLLNQIDGGSAHYNMFNAIELKGTIQLSALKTAFQKIVDRHLTLKTNYHVNEEGEAQQVINHDHSLLVTEYDISGFSEELKQAELETLLREEAATQFDLENDLILRVGVVKLSDTNHILMMTVHHIASDGWSMSILMNEFSLNYQAALSGEENHLPELDIQYSDYAHWQHNHLKGETLEEQLVYWEKQLEALPAVHSLPLERSRPKQQTFNGDSHRVHIANDLAKALGEICQASGATLFMGLHAVFSVLLARYANETDIVIGTPVANREDGELAGLIGFFVNNLVLRSDLSNNPTFKALLEQSKKMLLDAYSHQQVPFEQIVERLQPERNLSHSPLFQIMLVLQNNEEGVLELPGLQVEPIDQKERIAKYDLTLTVTEGKAGLDVDWEFNSDLFGGQTIAKMAEHFETLLASLLASPETPVNDVEILSKKDQQELLVDLNRQEGQIEKQAEQNVCIHTLIERQAVLQPDAIAVVYENTQLTYRELNTQANQLAHYLVNDRHVKPESLVGICVDKSLEMVVGILAVLKAGGAYVPLDPGYPEARLQYMEKDAELTTILTLEHLMADIPFAETKLLVLNEETLKQTLNRQPQENIPPADIGLSADNAAYLIYTSGSTGNPKGVLVEHNGFSYHIQSCIDEYGFGNNENVLQFSSISFDAAQEQVFTTLCSGSSLFLRSNELWDEEAFYQFCVRSEISIANLPPSYCYEILRNKPIVEKYAAELKLKTMLIGGEAFKNDLVKLWDELPVNFSLINAYGPTETVITACKYTLTGENTAGPIPIGKPFGGRQCFVLNNGKLAPKGVVGELYIGGVALARGYWNRDDLTKEKFVVNPFYNPNDVLGSEYLYQTGDSVRWLPDGNLEFLGRVDDQVKIRGFRIELGEIENAITQLESVKDVVVVAKPSVNQEKQLVAYITKSLQEKGDDADLVKAVRESLLQQLPEYMVPSAYVVLNELPLMPNGKVNVKALPEPDMAALQQVYVAPKSQQEEALSEIWQSVLGVDQVGLTDNFFNLGGHSLLATRLVAKVNKEFDTNLSLNDLFKSQTLETFSALLSSDKTSHLPPLNSASREGDLLSSYAQQRLWLMDQIEGESTHYNIPGALVLKGDVNYQALEHAFVKIIERHESLRTSFSADKNGQVLQTIQSEKTFELRTIDLSEKPEEEQKQALKKLSDEAATAQFDLSSDLLLRTCLVKVDSDKHILLLTMHHIASDGWSLSILIKEFSELYSAMVEGRNDSLPQLEVQYADYAQWQRSWLQGEELENQLGYWETQLQGLPVVHSLPLDHSRPQQQTFTGDSHQLSLSEGTTKLLNKLCLSRGATLFMGLHAAFSAFLSRYSNEQDIVIGTPIANREQDEIANLIGFFVNNLVLRSDLSTSPSFVQLLEQSKNTLLDAYRYQQVPFDQIVERLQPQRSLSHSPLFQVMMVLQNNESAEINLSGLTISPYNQDVRAAKYDLTLSVSEENSGLFLDWEYNTDLFEQQTIAQMAKHFSCFLEEMLRAPEVAVFDLDMLVDPADTVEIKDWNNTSKDFPNDVCVPELFEQQVENNAQAVAVTYEGKSLTYEELNRKANQLANYLIDKKHVKPDTLVGICAERSLEMVISIVAILKAGGAYVPLDPELPQARLQYMLDDGQLDTVLTQTHLQAPDQVKQIPVKRDQAICLDSLDIQNALAQYSDKSPVLSEMDLQPHHLAYVIYTSGSTGNPKGVMVSQQALINRVDWMNREYGSSTEDRILQKTPFSFDVSVWEFIWPLITGASIVLAKPGGHKDPGYLTDLIQSESITKLHFVPSMLASMLEHGDLSNCDSIRQVFCSGEALGKHHVDEFFRQNKTAQLHNLYGPTEAAIDVSYWDCSQEYSHLTSIPIGAPIQNIELQVLDKNLKPVPCGVAGELHIGGVGLARGYLNRAELTAEKFIDNPNYNPNDISSSNKLYKTGDLARWLPKSSGCSGNIEFLGRIDFQVKIRGFRIELGEIENVLTSTDQVKDAVVVAKTSVEGNQYLVAYITSNPVAEEKISNQEVINQVRESLLQTLPEYMVPSAFVTLPKLPLNPNGKVDRKALPEPDFTAQKSEYVAPETENEKVLCEIWQDVLGMEKIGVNDNFFQLGGHSLLVMLVISKLQEQSRIIDAKTFFANPVLVNLARKIEVLGSDAVFKAPENKIPEACKKIAPDMLTLVNLSEEEIAIVESAVRGGVENIQDIYPLAPMQEGILFHHMINEKTDPYVLPSLYKFSQEKDVDAFIDALQYVVNRHDVLRTAILWEGLSQPVQVVCRDAQVKVEHLDLSDTEKTIEEQLKQYCLPQNQWMDLTQAPLIQLKVAKSDDKHYVMLQYHHIISDHVGLEIIQSEIAAYQSGLKNNLPKPVPYRNFVAHTLELATQDSSEQYFKEIFADVDEPTAPFDLHDVENNGTAIRETRKFLSQEVCAGIRSLAKDLSISPSVLFHAAWSLVVARCSGRDDVVFGTVMSGRLQGTESAESMLGVFINTLPFRVKLNDKNIGELVEDIRLGLSDLLAHEQASLSLAQACSGLSGRTPLFTAVLNYRHTNINPDAEAGSNGIELIHEHERSNYPLNVSVDDLGHDFALHVQADKSVSATSLVDCFEAAIISLVKGLAESPALQVNALEILPEREKTKLVNEVNITEATREQNLCVHELFERMVQQYPDHVAVRFDGNSLNYKELNKQANQLASYLVKEKNVNRDELVGVFAERSVDMVVAVLAVMKAGAAYVPLDPDYPQSRLEYMVNDAKLNTVLCQKHLLDKLPVSEGKVVCIDDELFTQNLRAFSDQNLDNSVLGLNDQNLVYLIYTSGSTGNPKGVSILHRGAVNYLSYAVEHYFEHAEGAIVSSPLAFDATVTSLLAPLCCGQSIELVKQDGQELEALAQILRDTHKPLLFKITPAHLDGLAGYFDGQQLSELPHTFVVGGDQLTTKLTALWKSTILPEAVFINEYGPTETVVGCSIYEVRTFADIDMDSSAISIGKPIDNTELFVLDAHLNLVPAGVAGELYIGGEGLARGYLNREDLTEERFIQNPFFNEEKQASSQRLYKTGDLVKWICNEDGHPENLEFLGRIDHQVKIRGFRIELGEIESAIADIEHVQDVVVVAKTKANDDKYLAAYVTSNVNEKESLVDNIRSCLVKQLPDYMVPTWITCLDALPLTSNGKVDRKALPEPDMSENLLEYVAPRTDIEASLCKMWQEILDIEKVGIKDNFFLLGGNSLLATRLIARINQFYQVNFNLKALFETNTLEELALSLSKCESDESQVSSKYPALLPVDRSGELLTSYTQQRLWLIDKIENGSRHYNIPGGIKLSGDLNYEALNKAFTCIIDRHESLRTVFQAGEGGLVQQIIKPSELYQVPRDDLSTLSEGQKHIRLAELYVETASAEFDLSTDLMVRTRLVKVADNEHVLLVTMHHIASDGWSMSILVNEFSALYRAFVEGKENPLPPLAIQYADYSQWQRNWLQGDVLEAHLGYWEQQLRGLPVVHGLPLDHSRPQHQTFAGNNLKVSISKSSTDALMALCQSAGATLFMGLHAVFSVLLSRYSNERDIVIGTPIANREQAEVEGLIGFFMNNLVLRSDLDDNPSFETLLNQSKQTLLDAYSHQQVPFEQVVDRVRPERSLSHSPLFQVMLVLQNKQNEDAALPGLNLSVLEQNNRVAKYDLTLTVSEESEGLSLDWEFNTDLFESATIERFACHFNVLLDSLVKAPETSVFAVDMLPCEEADEQINRWNQNIVAFEKGLCIHEHFEAQAGKTPDNIALVFEDESLTFAQLNSKANQLAHYLVVEKGITPDTFVGICMERSLNLVISILAILKAGGAYVPLDPDLPEARLTYMLEDADLRTVLTESQYLQRTPVGSEQAVLLDDADLQKQLENMSANALPVADLELTSKNRVYAIYTSGSTGKPKGVMVTHEAVMNRIDWMFHQYGCSSDDKILQKTPFSFDVSVWEFIFPLTKGARLVLAKPGGHKDPKYLTALVKEQGITRLHFVPSMLGSMLAHGGLATCRSVEKVFCSGEALQKAHVEDFFKQCPFAELHNLYGPTEAAIEVSYWDCANDNTRLSSIPIGAPIANVQLYVLDEKLKAVPQGVAGELHIGGICLAQGYLNRDELTNEKFIANPFFDETQEGSSTRLYKTGDLVRWLPELSGYSGNIEFLGRIDHQVKIRGFRIELGEIENALISHKEINEAVVVAKLNNAGDQQLVAYISKNPSADTDQVDLSAELRQHLSVDLPEYMVPDAFAVLQNLPLNPSGKVDRKALPDVDVTQQLAEYVAPETETEKMLCQLWQEILNLPRVGIDDNFFNIGGNSLSAVKLLNRLEQELDMSLDVKSMFQLPDIRSLAAYLDVIKPNTNINPSNSDSLEIESFQI